MTDSDERTRPARSTKWLHARDRILIIVALCLSPYAMSITSWTVPPPGRPNGNLAPCPLMPNCVSSKEDLRKSPYFESLYIEPLVFQGNPATAMEQLKVVLRGMPRMRIVEDEAGYIRAEASSLILRFVDDVEFQLQPVRRWIDIRSAARVGYTDFGANRKRVEEIRRRFVSANTQNASSH